MNKEILVIVPARGGSKGLPRKNIKYLADKPMIAWTILTALESKYISRVVVTTEDKEIADISLEYGAQVPFLRPEELALDNTPGIDPIIYTVKRLMTTEQYNPDYIMILQPTSPLRSTDQLNESIELFLKSSSEFDSLISVTELEHPRQWNRIISSKNELLKIENYDDKTQFQRQNFSTVYRLNGAIYIVKTDKLINNKIIETERTYGYIMDRESSIDIDSIDDFNYAEYIFNKRKFKL